LLTALFQASVVILGTGNPNADPERSGPAVAVIVNQTAYLVDAGAGVMRRAAAAAARHELPQLQAGRIGVLFLTHLHSDHTIGVPDVIHTGWVAAERTAPLRVFGPAGTRRMMEHLTEAWRQDIRIRTEGDQPHTPDGWKVDATDIAPGVVYRDSNVTVTAIPVPHTNWDQAFGYRFEGGGSVIVISGDTRPSEALADACNGCDVLVHEVYSLERFLGRPAEWQRYHAGAHTSTAELALLAQRARPRLLVLHHQLYWGATDEELLREIRAAGYDGPTVSAADLLKLP
jgi:ribonuclease BN (tRNA processing enzyme)